MDSPEPTQWPMNMEFVTLKMSESLQLRIIDKG